MPPKPIKRRGTSPKQLKNPYFAIVLTVEAYNAMSYIDSGIKNADAVIGKRRLVGTMNTLAEAKLQLKRFTKNRIVQMVSNKLPALAIKEAIGWYIIVKCQDVSPYDTRVLIVYDVDPNISDAEIDKILILV